MSMLCPSLRRSGRFLSEARCTRSGDDRRGDGGPPRRRPGCHAAGQRTERRSDMNAQWESAPWNRQHEHHDYLAPRVGVSRTVSLVAFSALLALALVGGRPAAAHPGASESAPSASSSSSGGGGSSSHESYSSPSSSSSSSSSSSGSSSGGSSSHESASSSSGSSGGGGSSTHESAPSSSSGSNGGGSSSRESGSSASGGGGSSSG